MPEIAYALIWVWLLNTLTGLVNVALGAPRAAHPSLVYRSGGRPLGVVLLSLFIIGEGFVVVMASRRLIQGELGRNGRHRASRSLRHLPSHHSRDGARAPPLLAARDVIFSLQITFVPAMVIFDGGPPPNATTYLPFFIYRNGFEYLRYGCATGEPPWSCSRRRWRSSPSSSGSLEDGPMASSR